MNSKTLVFCALVLCLHGGAAPAKRDWFSDFLYRSRHIWSKDLQDKDILEVGLELHNFMRDDHDTPPLKMDAALSEAAKATASGLVHSADFEGLQFGSSRSGNQFKFSQNVFNISDEWLIKRPRLALLYGISAWYEPINDYDHQNPTVSSFTRLIWKASTDFGLGIATKGKDMVIVANYAPPSEEVVTPENEKLFQENVLPERKREKNPSSPA